VLVEGVPLQAAAMGWGAEIESVRVLASGPWTGALLPCLEGPGGDGILSSGVALAVGADDQGPVLDKNIPPTLPSLAAIRCPTLVSDLVKGG
jgi:hypothetical protein